MKTTRKILIILFFCIGLLGICPSAVSAAKTDHTLPSPILTLGINSPGENITTIYWGFDTSDGYIYGVKHAQVEYSASAKFKDAKKVKVANTASSYDLSHKKIKKFNGKLYVRVRELYVTNSGTEVYGPWSNSLCIELVKISKKNFPGLYKTLKSGTYDTYVSQNGSDSTLKTFYYDRNQDGWLDADEISAIASLTVSDSISNLKGIEHLTSLMGICLSKFTGTKADFSQNLNLSNITIERQDSQKLTVISPTARHVSILGYYTPYDKPKELDFSACDSVVDLTAYACQSTLTTLKLPKEKSNLRILSIDKLKCNTLDLNAYKNLEQLYVYSSDLSSIKVKKCKELRYFYLFYCSTIKSVDLSANTKLRGADFYHNDKLTVSNVKAPKKAKITSNTGKWWYQTDSYKKDMERI